MLPLLLGSSKQARKLRRALRAWAPAACQDQPGTPCIARVSLGIRASAGAWDGLGPAEEGAADRRDAMPSSEVEA